MNLDSDFGDLRSSYYAPPNLAFYALCPATRNSQPATRNPQPESCHLLHTYMLPALCSKLYAPCPLRYALCSQPPTNKIDLIHKL